MNGDDEDVRDGGEDEDGGEGDDNDGTGDEIGREIGLTMTAALAVA